MFSTLFWPLFSFKMDLVSYCLFPIVFTVIFARLLSKNVVIIFCGLKQWQSRPPDQPSISPMFASAVAVVVVWIMPFGYTWEAWHLDRYWRDYNAAIAFFRDELEQTGRFSQLPDEFAHLSRNGVVSYEPIAANLDQIYFQHSEYIGYGPKHRILYCQNEPTDCYPYDAVIRQPPTCMSIRPHWYRCTFLPFG